MKIARFLPLLLISSSLSASRGAQTPAAKPLPLAATMRGGTLLQFDFNAPGAWRGAAAYRTPALTQAQVSPGDYGTIDVAGSTQASGALQLSASPAAAAKVWAAGFTGGKLALKNSETNLGKLTLSFSLSASMARPVLVKLASYNAAGARTGGLETLVYPAAPDFYQRYALELSTFQPSGAGKFQPTAPLVQFALEIGSAQGWPTTKSEVRLDNVNFASPAYYVSAGGNDQNDGRTEKTAFATPQKALDVARPGDIIDVMNGTYKPVDVQGGIASFRRGGTPAAWIVLKNYPGQNPLFFLTNAWAGVRIGRDSRPKPADGSALPALPTPCYLEVRGLHVRGEGDVAKEKYAEFVGKSDPRTNGNGIMADSGNGTNTPHHLRFADNLVEFCPGAGITAGGTDWVTIENNVIRNNCWPMIYAGSGVSLLGTANFDGAENIYKDLVRNNTVSGNRCFVPWAAVKRISDGNGIIVDSNHVPTKNQSHQGRTLICNNVSFNNGGSGIHAFRSHRVDIINNTVYLNSASPELPWGQLFVQISDDMRIINNIVVAPPDQPVNTVGATSGDQNSKNVVRAGNLYFGGGSAPLMGEGDKIADPLFVNPSIDEKVADFHLKPGSPAFGAARIEPLTPVIDLNGKPRGVRPSRGAYQ